MKNFEDTLLAGGELAGRGKRALIEHIGKAIAALALLMAGIFTFTDIGLAEIFSEEFTLQALLFSLCASVIYFSLEGEGESLALLGERGTKADAALTDALERVGADAIGDFAEFLGRYAEDELIYRRKRRLLAYGKSYEEYLSYLDGGKVTLPDRLRFLRVRAIRPLSLSAEGMLAGGASEKSERVKNPAVCRARRLFGGLIPSLVSLFFTVSVAVSLKEMGGAEIAEGVFRLAALLGVGLRGYLVGYRYVTEVKLPWLSMKERLIRAFLSAKEKRERGENPQIPIKLQKER